VIAQRVKGNSNYFDELLSMIPAKLYYISEDTEGFNKYHKRVNANAEKVSKKVKIQNEISSDNIQSSLRTKGRESALDIQQTKIAPMCEGDTDIGNCKLSLEELKNRLAKRIEELSTKRNIATVKSRTEFLKNRKKEVVTRNHNLKSHEMVYKRCDAESDIPRTGKERPSLQFSKVDLEGKNEKTNNRKLTASQALKKLENEKERIEQMSPMDAVRHTEKSKWEKAVAKAHGEKVSDDPKLLKKSLKRQKKLKERKEKEWKERKESLDKLQRDKQKKREENIKKRKAPSNEKKHKKKRAGFEG
jgi:hypothetical protein